MRLEGKKVIVFVSDDFEDLEFWYLVYWLWEEGVIVYLIGEEVGCLYKGKYGVFVIVDYDFKSLIIQEYDVVFVFGGWVFDKLRRYLEVLDIICMMNEQKKLIGQICYVGWVFILVGIFVGKKVMSMFGIKDDMINVGVQWLDEVVVIDGYIVLSCCLFDFLYYVKVFVDFLVFK